MIINRSVDNVIVLAATQYVSNTTVTAATLEGMRDYHTIVFLMKFETSESTAGDKLQIFYQRTIDGGATWDDIGASSLVTEADISTTLYKIMTITSNIEPGTSDDEYTPATEALTASTTKDVPWGDQVRVQVVQTEGTALDITLTITGLFKSN